MPLRSNSFANPHGQSAVMRERNLMQSKEAHSGHISDKLLHFRDSIFATFSALLTPLMTVKSCL